MIVHMSSEILMLNMDRVLLPNAFDQILPTSMKATSMP